MAAVLCQSGAGGEAEEEDCGSNVVHGGLEGNRKPKGNYAVMFAPVKLFGRKDDLKSAQRFSALCAIRQS
jgi:hypothetical protein